MLATTHHPEVKAWASGAPRAANAAVGVDVRDLPAALLAQARRAGRLARPRRSPRAWASTPRWSRRRAGPARPERRALEALLTEAAAARAAADEERDAARGRARGRRGRRGRGRRAGQAELERAHRRAPASAPRPSGRRRGRAPRPSWPGLTRELSELRGAISEARREEAGRAAEARPPPGRLSARASATAASARRPRSAAGPARRSRPPHPRGPAGRAGRRWATR